MPDPPRVDRREVERRRLDVVGGGELDLAEQVAPVGRERRERGVPGLRADAAGGGGSARRPPAVCRTTIRSSRPVRAARRRAAASARRSASALGPLPSPCDAGARARPVSARSGWSGAEQRRARGRRCGRSASVRPSRASTQPAGQLGLEVAASRRRVPSPQNVHSEPMAKVEKKRALSEDRLRDFLREMLLIRRFEEKVEERFRAGELPGLPARRDRPGGGRGRRLRGDGGRRRLRLDPSRARPHARARNASERADGGAVREARGLLARLRRLDAPLRRRARQPRRERGRRRRAAGARRRRARVQAARRAARRGRVLRRRRHQHRHLPRVAQPGAALEDEDAVRLREQRVGRVDARLAALAGLGRHVQARASPTTCTSIKVDGQDVEKVYEKAPARRSTTSAPGRARCSSTSRPTGCTATTSATRRSTAPRRTATRRPRTTRSCGCASGSRSPTEEWQALEDEVHGIVEAAVEFAKNGTDPQPEDA